MGLPYPESTPVHRGDRPSDGVGEVAMSNLTPECDLRHMQAAPDHGVCVADFGQSTPKGREACCAPVSRRASMSR